MWKPEHRLAAGRGGLRYPSDLNAAEWALIAALIPPAWRAAANGQCAGGSQRDLLCAFDRLPMECFAERPAPEEHCAFLFHAVGLGRHTGTHPRHALCCDA